jgi:hypothetical protein
MIIRYPILKNSFRKKSYFRAINLRIIYLFYGLLYDCLLDELFSLKFKNWEQFER